MSNGFMPTTHREEVKMLATQDPVVIAAAARMTAGALQGAFEGASATRLGSVEIREALSRAAVVKSDAVDECLRAIRMAPR